MQLLAFRKRLYLRLPERIQLLFVKSGTGKLLVRYHERI